MNPTLLVVRDIVQEPRGKRGSTTEPGLLGRAASDGRGGLFPLSPGANSILLQGCTGWRGLWTGLAPREAPRGRWAAGIRRNEVPGGSNGRTARATARRTLCLRPPALGAHMGGVTSNAIEAKTVQSAFDSPPCREGGDLSTGEIRSVCNGQ